MPNVSPKSSLKNGPTTPCGSVPRMSPTFLRTWYQTSAISDGRRRCLEVDEDRRLPGRRVAAHAVEVARLLQRALQPLGDLLQRLLDRRAGPGGGDDHRPDRDRRVLAASEAQERQRAGHHRDDHHEDDQRAALQRPLGQIGADHCRSRAVGPSARAAAPGRRRSRRRRPQFEPRCDVDAVRIGRPDLDGARRDRSRLRVDDPDRRLPIGPDDGRWRDLDARGCGAA